jgi:riboflavin synthase
VQTFGKRRRVNIERSVRALDRLSGHIVRGVVEDVGRVQHRRPDGDATVITYSAPDHILANLIERGPLCVDGVSLTVIAKSDRRFAVSIVAYTGTHATLLEKAVGDPVSLESDILIRYVGQAAKNHGLWKPRRWDRVTSARGIQQSWRR